MSGIEIGNHIGIRIANEWQLFQVSELLIDEQNDLCLITFDHDLNGGLSPDIFDGVVNIGQHILACGFPLGFEQNLDLEDINTPMPLIKSGIFSGRIIVDEKQQLLFDLHNNVGFSGGPIFYWDLCAKKVKIAGIISNYKFDAPNYVYERRNGNEIRTDSWTRDNSGFAVAYKPKTLLEKQAKVG